MTPHPVELLWQSVLSWVGLLSQGIVDRHDALTLMLLSDARLCSNHGFISDKPVFELAKLRLSLEMDLSTGVKPSCACCGWAKWFEEIQNFDLSLGLFQLDLTLSFFVFPVPIIVSKQPCCMTL